MKKGRIIFGALVVSILLFVPAARGEPWQNGESWGYLWESDFSEPKFITGNLGELENLIQDVNVSGVHLGKWVYAYYVEYRGIENGYHRFDFRGVQYAWAYVDMDFSISTDFGVLGKYEMAGKLNMRLKSIWVEFHGYFYLGMKNVTTWSGERTVYALYLLSYTMFTKEDLDYEIDSRSNVHIKLMDNTTNGTIESYTSLKGNFNLSFSIECRDGLPYLPVFSDDISVSDFVNLAYTAHAKVNLSGRWSFKGSNETETKSASGNIRINVDKEYSDNITCTFVISKTGNSVKRPGILATAATRGLGAIGCVGLYTPTSFEGGDLTEPNMREYLDELLENVKTTCDSNWYRSENLSGYGSSQAVSRSRVMDIIEQPKQLYGTYTEPSKDQKDQQGNNFLFLLIGAVVIAAVVVAVVVAVIVKRKKQPPAPQQVQEMPQQYQYQQVQQQYQVPPSQPPMHPQQPQQPQPPTY